MAASARMRHGTTSAAIRLLPGDSCEVIASYAATDLIAAYSESYSLLDSITILTTRSCSSRGYFKGRAMESSFEREDSPVTTVRLVRGTPDELQVVNERAQLHHLTRVVLRDGEAHEVGVGRDTLHNPSNFPGAEAAGGTTELMKELIGRDIVARG